MNAIISSAVPAEAMEPFRALALEEAVEAVMRGERYPAKGFPAIDMSDLLDQCVSVTTQADDLCRLLCCTNAADIADAMLDIENRYEQLLRAHLAGSEIVESAAQAMYDDEVRMDEEDASHE